MGKTRTIRLSRGFANLVEAGKIPASAISRSGNIKWTYDILSKLSILDLTSMSRKELETIYKQNYYKINKTMDKMRELENQGYIVPSMSKLKARTRLKVRDKEGKETGEVKYITEYKKFKHPEEIKTQKELTAYVNRMVGFLSTRAEGGIQTYTEEGVKKYYDTQVIPRVKSIMRETIETRFGNGFVAEIDGRKVRKSRDELFDYMMNMNKNRIQLFWKLYNKSQELEPKWDSDDRQQEISAIMMLWNPKSEDDIDMLASKYFK